MKEQNRKITYILIGLPLIVLSFLLGVYYGGLGTMPAVSTTASAVTVEQFAPFWRAWSILDEKMVTASSTDTQTKIYGSIQGLAESYGDPYTTFFPPAESKIFKEDIAGDFGGVGMEIGIKNKQLQVISPIKGSPADKASVKAGDLILSVNSTSTAGMSSDQAVKFIRGPKGTEVKIMFLPVGSQKPVTKTIVRDTIIVPTIDTTTKPGGISVISLYSFTATSPNLFRQALREFILSGNHKLILDLRNNPGGYLDAAWDIASWFLPAGKIVVTEDFGKNGSPNIFRSKGYDIFNDKLRMIVLVDGGSASASEILAGALQENGVAKLVGTKTFGKGSVQELVSLTSDTSLKITIARWLTPNGHNLSHDGLVPDYEVPVTEKDLQNKNDVQMAKAVELLQAIP